MDNPGALALHDRMKESAALVGAYYSQVGRLLTNVAAEHDFGSAVLDQGVDAAANVVRNGRTGEGLAKVLSG